MENILMFIAVVYVLHLIVGSQLIKKFFDLPENNTELPDKPHTPPQPPVIIDQRPIIIINQPPRPQPAQQQYLPQPVNNATFVSVIFKRGDRKSYDYFLGNNYNVRVGDFVIVYARDKKSKTAERKIAQVVFISSFGDVSPYARSEIVGTSSYRGW